jgi:hypothetical protein
MDATGQDLRRAVGLWTPPLALVAWVAASVPFSVKLTAWGLAALCLVMAVTRWVYRKRSALAVRRRAVDVSVLGVFALAFAFLAWTGQFG